MTVYGLTAAGFVLKRMPVIKQELDDASRAAFGAGVDLSSSTPLGMQNGIHAERESLIWEQMEAVYLSQFPATATGVPLDNAVGFNGIKRRAAEKSQVTATLSGSPGTPIAAGSVASVLGNRTARFVTKASATIGVGGTVSVDMEAETAGKVQAPAASLTVIETVIGGWTAITNPLDSLVGRERETDPELILRDAESTQKAGAGVLEAIRADVLEMPGVVDALVFENDDDVVDAGGRPPHSFETVILGGVDADLALLIWQDKPAGIRAYGNTTTNIVDSQGFTRPIGYSRPTLVPIWIELDLTTTGDYPAGGDALVKSQILAYNDTLSLGDDVIVSPALISFLAKIPGITGIVIRIGKTASPTLGDNVPMEAYEIADFDTSRITVNS